MDGDMPDKSTNFFPHALHHHSFHFLMGTFSPRWRIAAILAVKMFAIGRIEDVNYSIKTT